MAKKFLSLVLIAVCIVTFCSCQEKSRLPSLNIETAGRTNRFEFSKGSSGTLKLSNSGYRSVLEVINRQRAEYEYADLYELDEVKKRLDFEAKVENHKYSALDKSGALSASYLADIVIKNNEEYLSGKPFGYKNVAGERISELCGFVVKIINQMISKYPEIDWERVYCNLGNLKILYKNGTLSYAQVTNDIVLTISENNTGVILNMEGENGFARVLTHEIMHIIQLGCSCENIENCERRAGISVFWEDFPLNTTDWLWFVEGSAERNMCNLTGEEAVSYQYKMDYICSFTMSVLLREDVKADTMETISFYSDPELLFSAFGCKAAEERDEILKMMITMNVLQSQPSGFYEAYKAKTGIDPSENEETLNRFSYSLKPAVCITLAKEFYENLILYLRDEKISQEDLFFLINLFEGHLNQHLKFNSQSGKEVNGPFIKAYVAMREGLFTALKADNGGLDVSNIYAEYNITSGENKLNAQVSFLPEQKREFLLERADWQSDLRALGEKVEK